MALVVAGTAAFPLFTGTTARAAAFVQVHVTTSRDSFDPTGPRAGDEITQWEYLLNEDNTGDPYDDPADCEADADGNFPVGFPDNCAWPSMHSFEPGSPIVTSGDQDDFLGGGLELPEGRYLISVKADGHKIGGAHFTVPAAGPMDPIEVFLDPYPLQLVTLRARVFNDLTTNGQIDLPAELVGPGESMAGFTATVADWGGEVTTDWYGNPICSEYLSDGAGQIELDADGQPTLIEGSGGKCESDTEGNIVIPNLGPNRYAMVIAPPVDDPDWIQTTTLEGGLDWDIWAMEGYTGYDTEFNVGGESVPWVNFGYVRTRSLVGAPNQPAYYSGANGTGVVKGTVARYDAYVPGVGQQPTPGDIWGGFSGGKVTGPIEHPMLALLDLQDGDRAIWVGEGEADGSFRIEGIRDGEYQLTIWQKDILTLLDLFQVTIKDGEVVDTGVLGLTGWFANYSGHVFLDYNENGRMDPGEPGVPDFGLTLRGRENNAVENGQNAATTDHHGYYEFEKVYPYTMWTVMEAYSDRFHTTGITYQASNQPTPTTVRGGGVDINVLPIIGQSMRIDWGIAPYAPGTNGSIAGSVFYDTTRNELDPRLAAVEDWSTGIPGIGLSVYNAELQNGEWVKGALIETVVSETWERPGPCTARDADGNPIPDQLVFPYDSGHCIEAPLTGIQVDPMVADGDFGAAVNGNFGFGDLDPGRYIVEIDIPTDIQGRPLYKVEDEESVNVFAGDVYVAQNTVGAPSAGGGFDFGNLSNTVGANLPTVDPATQVPGAAPTCVGASHTVDISETGRANAEFADAGGTPFQGQVVRGCEAKLVEVVDGRSVAPSFTLYTDVPPPAHFWGYTVDDLNIDTNPRRTSFGEKRGLSYSPTGVYNWEGRLITQVNADVNGIWEVLLPSTTTMNCPSPSGVCAGMYRFVGNDPGPPTDPFRDYNPNYRTIAANFQGYPGINTVADTAPTQVGASILAPGGQFNALAVCAAELDRPQVFRVNRPWARIGGTVSQRTLVIFGEGFGRAEGEVRLVDLETDAVVMTLDPVTDVTRWNARRIDVTIPDEATLGGAFQLEIVTADGRRPVNTITYHVLNAGVGYNPLIVNVAPTSATPTIQSGVDRFPNPGDRGVLVVVYPAAVTPENTLGAYFENVIVSTPVTIQGVGPGGTYSNGRGVLGTVVHGGNFWTAQPNGDEPVAEAWYTRLGQIDITGNQNVADGEVFYVVAGQGEDTFSADRIGRIDGMKITGGDQRDFPGNITQIGGFGTPTGAVNATTQGGGVFLHGYAREFRLTNNVFESNGGAYGGAIRVGTPFAGDNENDGVIIARNRIVANGGTQLAGAIAIFNGADGYVVADNEICGNSSTEYGGGISHFGYSPGGSIHHNRVVLNSAYDEGGGINIAGELPADPTQLSAGAGSVEVRNNIIAANLSNDDGGGLRFLQAGDFPFDVVNNMIVNNVSAHQGGGVALNDAPDVRMIHNTIAHNVTTATAVTSDGLPAPAGLSTTGHSAQLLAALETTYGAGNYDDFSNPELVGNVFSDNRAGTWGGLSGVIGISDADAELWDIGASDGSGVPEITYSLLDTSTIAPASVFADPGFNVIDHDPLFVAPKTTAIQVFTWRGFQRFRSAAIVSYDLSQSPFGDYHIQGSTEFHGPSPAVDLDPTGPGFDIDDESRPTGTAFDAGADEIDGALLLGPLSDATVFDDFERTDPDAVGNTNINYGLADPWWGGDVANNRVRITNYRGARVLRPMNVGRQLWLGPWAESDAQEAAITFTRTQDYSPTTGVGSGIGLILRATGATPGHLLSTGSSYVSVSFEPAYAAIVVRTKNPGEPVALRFTVPLPAGFGSGDRLLARIDANGDLQILHKPAGRPWIDLGTYELGTGLNAWPAAGTSPGGAIGLEFTGDIQELRGARLDDFQGGEVL